MSCAELAEGFVFLLWCLIAEGLVGPIGVVPVDPAGDGLVGFVD